LQRDALRKGDTTSAAGRRGRPRPLHGGRWPVPQGSVRPCPGWTV